MAGRGRVLAGILAGSPYKKRAILRECKKIVKKLKSSCQVKAAIL
jgi:hypothetical protein